MQKAFKYRVYPSKEQAQKMLSLLETHRRLYNNALAERKESYEKDKTSISYQVQSAQLKTQRKECLYLAECNFSSCQRTLKRLDRAFQSFFRRIKSGDKPGYPRFKGKDRFDSIDFTIGDGAKLTSDNKARFQNVGDLKIKLHRPIEGQIKTMSFRREAGHWYVIFSCDLGDIDVTPSDNPSVGIDLGLKSFLVTSEGEEVKPPKFYRKAQAKLRRLQRSVARKKKGGSNRKKAIRSLSRLHHHVANQRKDFHHKTANALIERYGKIVHEDLNIKGIAKSRLAKSTHDVGWAGFLNILSSKAECAGCEVISVNPAYTTQTCSNCGCLPDTRLTLSDRLYQCLHCGFSLGRDHNAAINILMAGTLPLGANVDGCIKRSPRSPRL
jgi:putative transposase